MHTYVYNMGGTLILGTEYWCVGIVGVAGDVIQIL